MTKSQNKNSVHKAKKSNKSTNERSPETATMVTQFITGPDIPETITAQAKPVKKPDIILNLLTRSKGATITQLQEATNWQPHSIRAVISGIRKKGIDVIRSQAKAGVTLYHAQKS